MIFTEQIEMRHKRKRQTNNVRSNIQDSRDAF